MYVGTFPTHGRQTTVTIPKKPTTIPEFGGPHGYPTYDWVYNPDTNNWRWQKNPNAPAGPIIGTKPPTDTVGPPNIYPQQPTEPPNIYPQQPNNAPTPAVKPAVTQSAGPIVVDAITAAGGPTPIQEIGTSTVPTPVVNTATGEVVGTVTLDQTTGTPVVTPITADVTGTTPLFTQQPTDWKPILYAGGAAVVLYLLFGGKKSKR